MRIKLDNQSKVHLIPNKCKINVNYDDDYDNDSVVNLIKTEKPPN